MPPRSYRLALATLALACIAAAFLIAPRPAWPATVRSGTAAAPLRAAPPAAATAAALRAAPPAAAWRWPVRGAVVGHFRLTPRTPFGRGQRRGIDIAAPPGTAVRAACRGAVTFAGPLPQGGLAISVRCGALVATYLHLGHVAVGRGARVTRGDRLGAVGPAGRLRLGARRAADRRGYLDPLGLLHDPAPDTPPLLAPAPRRRAPRPAPAPVVHRPALPVSPARPAPRRLPWPAYPALALVASALPVGGLVHRRRRRRAASVAGARAGSPAGSL